MKEVKVMPRFKCDFCKKRSTFSVIQKHEKRCYRNLNRFCDNCDNKGYTEEYYAEMGTKRIPCHFCEKFNPNQLKEIEAREKGELVGIGKEGINVKDIPF